MFQVFLLPILSVPSAAIHEAESYLLLKCREFLSRGKGGGRGGGRPWFRFEFGGGRQGDSVQTPYLRSGFG